MDIICIIAEMNENTLSLSIAINNRKLQCGFKDIPIDNNIKYKLAVCMRTNAKIELEASIHLNC